MSRIAYLDFDLQIQREGEGYCAQVLNSPGGQGKRLFVIPFSDLELDNFFLRFGRNTRAVRRIDSPEMEAAKIFGQRLFAAVFEGEVRDCLRSSLDEADRQQLETGLRIRLRFKDVPELVNLPWEYFYNPAFNRFLALSVETPLVRYLDLPERIRPPLVTTPLRVLVMISSPSDYPALDANNEWTKLRESVRDLEACGALALERLDQGTLSALQRQLRKSEYHIFHFVGHGGFDERLQDGVLVLEDERGRGRPVSGQEFGIMLHDERTLRLAVLNACEGARASRVDPFGGVAQSLVQQGIPAVIAMQFEISDEAAIIFAHEFYAGIADGYPVDAALAEARKAIYAGGNALEWGAPVLYLRAADGKVFDLRITRVQPRPKIQVQVVSVREPPNIAEYSAKREVPKPSPKGVLNNKPLWIGCAAVLILPALFLVLLVIWTLSQESGKDPGDSAQKEDIAVPTLESNKAAALLSSDNSLVGRAEKLRDDGKFDAAIALFEQAIKLDPKYVKPHRRLGSLYFKLGRYEEASAQFNEAVTLDPRDALSYSGLGAVYYEQKRYPEGIAACRRSMEIDPSYTEPRFHLGNIFLNETKYEDALKMFESVVDLDPSDAAAHYNIGYTYYLQDRYEEALPGFTRSVELDPKDVDGQINLARSFLYLGRHDDAEAAARRAIELGPKIALTYRVLGEVYRYGGSYDDAIAAFRHAIEMQPDVGAQHIGLGLSYARKNSLEKAAAEIDKALRLEPDNYWFIADQAMILALQGRTDEARRLWKKLLTLEDGKSAQSRLNLAMVKICLAEESPGDLEEVQRILSEKGPRRGNLSRTLEYLELLSRGSAKSPALEHMTEMLKKSLPATSGSPAQ